MALITNNKESLHNGVNEQPSEQRLDTQVSEMINCVPTLNAGLRKRNPTQVQPLSEAINYEDEMWQHSYDRGLAGIDEEKYSIIIGKTGGMSIININTGKVYTKANGGIIFDGASEEYLLPFVDANGYAAVTVKDTTFLVNKNMQPEMDNLNFGGTVSAGTYYYADFNFNYSPEPATTYYENTIGGSSRYPGQFVGTKDYAPYSFQYRSNYGYDNVMSSFVMALTRSGPTTDEVYYGARFDFNIDGVLHSEATSTVTNKNEGLSTASYTTFSSWSPTGYTYNKPELVKMSQFISDIISSLRMKLGTGYRVYSPAQGKVRVVKLDGADFALTPTASLTFSGVASYSTGVAGHVLDIISNPVQGDYFNGVTTGTVTLDGTELTSIQAFKAVGFLWIKSSNPTDPGYSYTCRVKVNGLTEKVFGPVTGTTTEGVATSFKNLIDADAALNAQVVGSVVRIETVTGAEVEYVSTSDSFGNQASSGFAHTVETMNDLPKSLGFPGTLVKVEGTDGYSSQKFWVKYDGSIWKEAMEDGILTKLNPSTMPHILTRNDPAYPGQDDFFSFKQYAGWQDRKIGDDDSNKIPSFIYRPGEFFSPIKDAFFFKNRLGLITETTVALSEVGEYGNFFRTSALTVLDSDPIDTAIDSTKAVRLEYAMYLENAVMLFSDKAQFKLSGGQILSPKSVQVSKTSAYEMNKRVRPLFMNNSIFFVANRGNHSAVMEYMVDANTEVSEAIDITAHVQTYIPGRAIDLSGSSIDNMLFVRSEDDEKTLYVYKYYNQGNQRVQSAWFKWEFNARVKSAFALGRTLNMMMMRRPSSAAENWILADGHWSMEKLWGMDKQWIMLESNLAETGQFEKMETAPSDISTKFFDSIIDGIGTVFRSYIDFGRWVLDIKAKGIKTIRGHLQFKTVEISSESGSQFYLRIVDTRTNKSRIIPSKYTVGKKPLVMGNAEKMDLEIVNWTEDGFQINSISYEGNYVSRNTPI